MLTLTTILKNVNAEFCSVLVCTSSVVCIIYWYLLLHDDHVMMKHTRIKVFLNAVISNQFLSCNQASKFVKSQSGQKWSPQKILRWPLATIVIIEATTILSTSTKYAHTISDFNTRLHGLLICIAFTKMFITSLIIGHFRPDFAQLTV